MTTASSSRSARAGTRTPTSLEDAVDDLHHDRGRLPHGSSPTSGARFHPRLAQEHGRRRRRGHRRAPRLELVKLSGCDDSSPYFQWVPNCQFRLRADIDPAGFAPGSLQVRIQGSAVRARGCLLTFDNGWFESPALTLNDGSGRNQYDLSWKSGNGNCNSPPPYCGGATEDLGAVRSDRRAEPARLRERDQIRRRGLAGVIANSLGPQPYARPDRPAAAAARHDE